MIAWLLCVFCGHRFDAISVKDIPLHDGGYIVKTLYQCRRCMRPKETVFQSNTDYR